MKQTPLSSDMIKDPTKVKSRFIGSFSKRQILCYGIAVLIGVPFYLLTKDIIGKESAALFMVALLFPAIICSIYEKDGLPAEKYFLRFIKWRFFRPMKREYRKENRFERMKRREQLVNEVQALEQKKKLTIKEYLRKRDLKLLLSGKKEEKQDGISVQQTVTFSQISPDGICQVKKGYYTVMIEFDDTNYKMLDKRERDSILQSYSDILNAFPPEMDYKVFLFSRRRDRRKISDKLEIPLRNDEFDFIRKENTEILKNLFEKSTDSIVKNRYLILGQKAVNIWEARDKLTKKAEEVIGNLANIGSEARILDGTERMKLMYEFFNQDKIGKFGFSYEDMQKTGDGFKDYIVPKKMDFSKAGLVKTEGQCMSTRYLEFTCANVDETMIESLADINECFAVSIHMQTLDPSEALKITREALINSQSAKMNQQKKAFDAGVDSDIISSKVVEEEKNAREILRNLNESNQKLIRTTFLVTAFGKTKREVNNIHDKVFSKFKGIGCTVYPLKYSQEVAINASAPIGICELNQPRLMLTNNAGILAPFRTYELMQDGNFIYYGLNKFSKNLILGDRKQLDNPNGLIIGIPGSGKSFAAKREIYSVFTNTDDDIIICDPEGEYFPLVESLGGTVVKLATNSADYLNPLDIDSRFENDKDALKTKSVFVLTLCECMVDAKYGLESEERGIIDNCLSEIYKGYFKNPVPEEMPTLEDLYNALTDYEPDYITNSEYADLIKRKAAHLANSMLLHVHGTQNYFNNRTNVDSHNRIICFDIRDLGTELKDLGMLIVQDAVWTRVSRNRGKGVSTRYYCDEFHRANRSVA
ncbi:MAG: PrgI family protein [Lachnospiraceae bacterium]|nr:PrgI family protein [Lachnospiraceae bacterium]